MFAPPERLKAEVFTRIPERLHAVGILAIDRAAQRGKFLIRVKVRLDRDQQRAFLLGLPDGLARLDAKLFCEFVCHTFE